MCARVLSTCLLPYHSTRTCGIGARFQIESLRLLHVQRTAAGFDVQASALLHRVSGIFPPGFMITCSIWLGSTLTKRS